MMRTELKRNMKKLSSPGHPKPYFISYLMRDVRSHTLWGRYGSLCDDQSYHGRACYADIRVGSYKYDQVLKGGLEDDFSEDESYDLRLLPIEDDEDAGRFALWRLSDAKYREAVSAYHQRRSRDINYLDENKKLPSMRKGEPDTSMSLEELESIDLDQWRKVIRRVSKRLKDFRHIKNSYVELEVKTTTKVFVSSEGIERAWNGRIYSLSAYLWFHKGKVDLESTLVRHTRRLNELPSEKELTDWILTEVEHLQQMESSEEMTSYAGPVLLAGQPAGVLIHEVLGHRLEGSRLLSDREGRTFQDKVGERITHGGVDIYDDPTRAEYQGQSLLGKYAYDDEGVQAQKVKLVQKGKLKAFLTTRAPIKAKGHKSNGHARNASVERPISRMGNLIVEPKDGVSWQDLKDQLIAEIKKRKLPFGLILLEVEGGETGTGAYDFQAFLGQITKAKKLYPDGREVWVRGVDFVGTPLASLSHIVSMGRELHVDNAYCGAESGSVPVSTVSPAMLVSNLELQAKDSSRLTEHILPLPWFE